MRIFLLDTHAVPPEKVTDLTATLPPFRREATTRCRKESSALQKILGFCLVRYAVRQIAPDADTETWVKGAYGKPRLACGKPFFNLSHTAHCIAVAVAEDMEVGIDVEEIKPHHAGLVRRYCSPEETLLIAVADDPHSAFIRLWTAKEAKVKELGTGIDGNLQNIPLNGVQNAPVLAGGVPHWLSVSPTAAMPVLEWVDPRTL